MILKTYHLILGILLVAQTKGQELDDFATILAENGLTFEKPVEFAETEIRKNGDLYYDYAMKLPRDSFEVRYTVFSLQPLLDDFKKSLNDPNIVTLDPNSYYRQMFMANILNVSQSGMENMPQISDFSPEAVKTEFGADYGGSSFFRANSEFGEGYEYCMMMVIHKKDIADVYVSFLGNDMGKFEEYMLKAFHAIRFND